MEILRLRDKLGANYARRLEKALNDFEELKNREKMAAKTPAPLNITNETSSQAQSSKSPPIQPQTPSDFRPRDPSLNTSMQSQEGMIVNTGDEQRRSTLTTTINPRLRPKASSNVSGILPPPVTAVI